MTTALSVFMLKWYTWTKLSVMCSPFLIVSVWQWCVCHQLFFITLHYFLCCSDCLNNKYPASSFIDHPPEPELIPPKEAIQDHPYVITCSVTHTCPSRPPTLTWSRGKGNEASKNLPSGHWEVMSILTFTPNAKDDHSDITCTAEFFGGVKSSSTQKLYLKREIFSVCRSISITSLLLKLTLDVYMQYMKE